ERGLDRFVNRLSIAELKCLESSGVSESKEARSPAPMITRGQVPSECETWEHVVSAGFEIVLLSVILVVLEVDKPSPWFAFPAAGGVSLVVGPKEIGLENFNDSEWGGVVSFGIFV